MLPRKNDTKPFNFNKNTDGSPQPKHFLSRITKIQSNVRSKLHVKGERDLIL